MPHIRAVMVLLAIVGTVRSAERITTPREFLGFAIGDDYHLANYGQLAAYWSKLQQESDRVRLVDIGRTEEGRAQQMAIVTSPANHRELKRYQETVRRLALVEGVNEAQARELAARGKAVVWIDGGLHATEVLCPQMLIEMVYRLASAQDAETRRILDDVIILFVHANPDGMELCSDWYMRQSDPKKRSLAGLPRLYQKYIGHDNNRDFYANTQSETRNMNRVMYREWFPQIVYNHHQTGPPGTVLFCPPFRDPFNYNVDPLVVNGIDALGAAMMQRFLVEGKPGATTRSGARYSTWWNGGLRTTCYFHNMIGLLTETIGSPTPSQIPFRLTLQLPRADYLAPISPGPWKFKRSIEYSISANLAVLDYASRHREPLLFNIWRMGQNAIERGQRDHWTITPKIVESARRSAGGERGGFARSFRDPAQRDPRGFIIPADQSDFLTATKFVNVLIETGVTVHRATAAFSVAGKQYPAGSYVVKSAQPFRAHVMDMFEPQDHPNDFAVPGGPPTPPYDTAGWTLAFQMGVKFDRILDGFEAPLVRLTDAVVPSPGRVTGGVAGWFLDSRVNDSFRAVNRLMASGESVRRLRSPFAQQPVGTFFVPRGERTARWVVALAKELGVSFVGTATAPGAEAVPLKPVRVGLWDRYGGSMPSGWTRWLLERFEFPFEVVFAPELDRGGLRKKYDVILLVSGAIPGRPRPRPDGGDTPPEIGPENEADIPPEYRGQRGGITPSKTGPQLQAFLKEGGTILTIGNSTLLSVPLGLPVSNYLMSKDKDGRESPLGREKFYVPGSLLRVRIDANHPLAWGMNAEADVMFSSSPVFRLPADAERMGLRRVAWFDGPSPLRSGWAWGQEHLAGGAAIVEARVGVGRLVLYGPEVLFRAQPHGTFKLVFNALVNAADSKPIPAPASGTP